MPDKIEGLDEVLETSRPEYEAVTLVKDVDTLGVVRSTVPHPRYGHFILQQYDKEFQS